mgnify:CR=1 FL=1
MISDFFQLIFMKVIITNDSLDSLLSVKISSDGGKSYSNYSVNSLKSGLTYDCSPKDLKVICDVNTLKYIQVLADGEKAASNIDLSGYLKIRDIYVDVYENPYYGKTDYDYLSDEEKEEIDELSELEQALYNSRYQYYYKSRDFNPEHWGYSLRLDDGTELNYSFHYIEYSGDYYYYGMNDFQSDGTYFIMVPSSQSYLDGDAFYTNARVHFIKQF